MTGGDARRGRRDNGLRAAEYAIAGDVDPRVGEHLLDVLALDGIAAYLRPASDVHEVTRSATLPDRPKDQLYVDRAHLSAARAYLTKLADESRLADEPSPAGAPSPTDSVADADDAWAQIVAGFNTQIDTHPWPDAEDLDSGTRGPAPPASPATPSPATPSPATPAPAGRATPPPAPAPAPPSRDTPPPAPAREPAREAKEEDEPSLLDALDTFGADLPDEDPSEGYTPPPAPPMPRPSAPTVFGVLGIIGGLVALLEPQLIPLVGAGMAQLLGFAALVTGFTTLVWRLRPGDEDEDIDPDDGARV